MNIDQLEKEVTHSDWTEHWSGNPDVVESFKTLRTAAKHPSVSEEDLVKIVIDRLIRSINVFLLEDEDTLPFTSKKIEGDDWMMVSGIEFPEILNDVAKLANEFANSPKQIVAGAGNQSRPEQS